MVLRLFLSATSYGLDFPTKPPPTCLPGVCSLHTFLLLFYLSPTLSALFPSYTASLSQSQDPVQSSVAIQPDRAAVSRLVTISRGVRLNAVRALVQPLASLPLHLPSLDRPGPVFFSCSLFFSEPCSLFFVIFRAKWGVFIPIALLQMVNMYWNFRIIIILIKTVRGLGVADDREEGEDSKED